MPSRLLPRLSLVQATIYTGTNPPGTAPGPRWSYGRHGPACGARIVPSVPARGDRPGQRRPAAGSRRRTPGLRREELAQLSGISVTWYTWLEQGRHISVSREVIESLARVLRMTPPEREHLFTVAGLALPAARPSARRTSTTPFGASFRRLDPNPGLRHQSVVGPTRVQPELLPPCTAAWTAAHSAERNVLWLFFTAARPGTCSSIGPTKPASSSASSAPTWPSTPGDPRGPELVATLTKQPAPSSPNCGRSAGTTQFRNYRKGYQHPSRRTADLRLHQAHRRQQRPAASHRAAASRPGHRGQAPAVHHAGNRA